MCQEPCIDSVLGYTGRRSQRIKRLPAGAVVWLMIAMAVFSDLDIPAIWRQIRGTIRCLWAVARPCHAIFVLVSPDDDPGRRRRLLAVLASRAGQDDFLEMWLSANDEQRMQGDPAPRRALPHARGRPGEEDEPLIERAIRELGLPDGCLVAVVRRGGRLIVPGGDTVLRAGDRLAVIGDEEAVRACSVMFSEEPP